MYKKLSIMLPVYNMELYIDKCLNSLVKQNWDNDVEVIIIDDGSTDASSNICSKYVSKYAYMKLYHKVNGGVASARNMALKYASGEYFYWVDPDDYIADDFWEKIKDVLDQGYDFIFFDLVYFSDKYHKVKCFGNTSAVIEKNEFIRHLCDGVKMASHLPTKILKKSLWDGVYFPDDISFGEDYAVFTYIAPKVEKVFYLHESLYNYRQHASSICHSTCVKDLKLFLNVVKRRYEYFLGQGYDVDMAGVLFVEYSYLKDIELRKSISSENYQVFFDEICGHLKKNKSVLLNSGLIRSKEKLIVYLLVFDMKIAVYILQIWRKLNQVCK